MNIFVNIRRCAWIRLTEEVFLNVCYHCGIPHAASTVLFLKMKKGIINAVFRYGSVHKKHFLLFVFVFVAVLFAPKTALAAGEFITTWQTTTADEQITIPTTGGGYNYDVDWGDSSASSSVTGDGVHFYATAGTHTVTITGTFPRIYFNNGGYFDGTGDNDQILSVEQWGTGVWTSMESAFFGTSNLAVNATDSPDLSGVTNMAQMFRASAVNQDISSWNVSNVTNMSTMFAYSAFNQDISSWNVSNVTDMSVMFLWNNSFNQAIGSWNVSNVTTMERMFGAAHAFNQPLNTWDVSSVTDMGFMFYDTPFDQNIGSWNVSNVTNMGNMFTGALSTNNYNALLAGWSARVLQSGVTFDAGGSTYSTSTLQRASIVSDHGWIITDGGAVAGVIESVVTGSATEGGGTASYTLVLTSQPTSTVAIALTADSTQVSLSADTLSFTSLNWDVPQTVTITAVNDSVAEATFATSVTHLVSVPADFALGYDNSLVVSDATVSILDNDTAGVTLSKTTASVTEGGATDSYTFVLTSAPTTTVTIIPSALGLASVSPTSLAFTSSNWSTPQLITVTAQ